MNIIIPCSGTGQRFRDAGFTTHKPLIPVYENGLEIDTILGEVIKQFSPTQDRFIFITNKENEDEISDWVRSWSYFYTSYTLDYLITSVEHRKLGPVAAVFDALRFIESHIKENEGVIISYCDFGAVFDYDDFKNFVRDHDASIMSYTGYHPHLQIEKNVYAVPFFQEGTGENGQVARVKEKHFVEVNERKLLHHSSGAYYFKSYEIMSQYVSKMLAVGETLNGEYYVSLLMNLLIDAGLTVSSWPGLKYFYQLGTPEDLAIFRQNADRLRVLNKPLNHTFDNQIMLMAGRSERFTQQGYLTPKPFMTVNGKLMHSMQEQYTAADRHLYVTADDYADYTRGLDHEYKFIEKNKIGPAYSYFQGSQDIEGEAIITSCDVLCKYDTREFVKVKDDFDVIVFATQNHPESLKKPASFSWIDHIQNHVIRISLKKPLGDRALPDDYLLLGSFWVRDNQRFVKIVQDFLKTPKLSGGEYYLDEAINYCILEGLKVGTTVVSSYYSFGTPDEYLESKYWLECF